MLEGAGAGNPRDERDRDGHDSRTRSAEPRQQRPVRIACDRPGSCEVVEQSTAEEPYRPVVVREQPDSSGLAREEALGAGPVPTLEGQPAAHHVRARGDLRAYERLHEVRLREVLLVEKDDPRRSGALQRT